MNETKIVLRCSSTSLSFEEIISRLEVRKEEISQRERGNRDKYLAVYTLKSRKKRRQFNGNCHGCEKKGHPFYKCYVNPESENY